MMSDIHRVKHDDNCRILAFPKWQLRDYRLAMEEAITTLLCAYGMTCGEPYRLTAQQSANLKRLLRLHKAVHEDHSGRPLQGQQSPFGPRFSYPNVWVD
ncbi:hypothetical protein [Methylobacterium soli]|uniref:Uncharacterized protein n=1 Tax=Methylobacterium soli TaxID=553447 RepID=A0A6L3T2B2_9HYPH|nr:hypothetical protein [Methylobacterium soli]KAB1080878.1 hypothetical protein F6X53_04090 [Methylobacterium soli]GJE45288.1 hypothetical protein AEGHOMDF_4482 [Methylobacterium soli]